MTRARPAAPRHAAARTVAAYAAAAAVFGVFLVVLKLFDLEVRHLLSVLLLLAAGAFVLSTLIDKVPNRSITFEEYFEYVGLGGFVAWALCTSVAALRRGYRPAPADAATSG